MASDETIVVEAPSVEEAIILGLTRLTATRDEVDIEVLDEGSRGFLGIGMRDARVRLSRKPHPAEGATVASEDVHARETAEPAPPAAPVEVETTAMEREKTPSPAARVPQADKAEAKVMAQAPAEAPGAAEVEPVTIATGAREGEQQRPSREKQLPSDGLDRDRVEAMAREIVANLLPGLSVDAVIEWVDEDRPTLWVSLEGRDAASLVGSRARNLHALQYLFRSLIYHKCDGDYNVVVDADGYRKRRRKSLESLAEQKAERAVALGTTVRLRPMPAHERRIIHLTLRNDDRVTTESVGKGRDRAVTIIPRSSSDADAS